MDRAPAHVSERVAVAPRPAVGAAALAAAGAILAGLGFRLYVATRPASALAARYVADDYFYFLSVAHHLASGDGSTFDGGVSFTNGYQPLFAWLLAGLFVPGLDKAAVLHGGLVLLALARAAAAWAAFRLLEAEECPWGGALAAGVLSLGLSHALRDLNGFETPLALAAVLWTLVLARGGARPETLGAACGIAFLARIDSLVLAVVLAARFARRREWAALRRSAAVFVLVAAPWIAWSVARFGTVVPDSAATKARARGGVALVATARAIASEAPRAMWPEALLGPRHAPRPMVVAAGGLVLLALAAAGARRFAAATAFAVLLAAAYGLGLRVTEAAALNRYLDPVWAVFVLLAASTRVLQHAAAVAILLALQLYDVCAYVRWDRATPPTASFVGAAYNTAPAVLGRVVPEGERVGAFDAGALGYASPRGVVNLDGLMNHDIVALHAACRGSRRACLLDYLRDRRITVLAGGTAFGWTQILPDWTEWHRLYESPPLRDGDRLVVLRVPDATAR